MSKKYQKFESGGWRQVAPPLVGVLAVIFTFDFPLKGGSHLPRIFSTFKAPLKGGFVRFCRAETLSPPLKGRGGQKIFRPTENCQVSPLKGGDLGVGKDYKQTSFRSVWCLPMEKNNCNCKIDDEGYLLEEEDVCQSCKDWHRSHN